MKGATVTANFIRLAEAKLCVGCECISDATTETCPHCGSYANWLSISRLLTEEPIDCRTHLHSTVDSRCLLDEEVIGHA